MSLRGNRRSALWSLTGALTSHRVRHFLWFADTFRGESRQRDREGRSVQYLAPRPLVSRNLLHRGFAHTPRQNFVTRVFGHLLFYVSV